MSESEPRSAQVVELAEEFLERHRRGERPTVRDYLERHPILADQIRAVFPALAVREGIALADDASTGVAGTAPAQPVPGGEGTSRVQLGDFRIIREVGRGGMGVVYEAEQISLGRRIALKVLARQGLAGSSHLQRFLFEARAAARLHHTNIVPVFGTGEQDGVYYYAMQFIRGRGLDVVFAEIRAGASDSATIILTASAEPRTAPVSGVAKPEGAVVTDRPRAEAEAVPDAEDPSAGIVTNLARGRTLVSYYQAVARVGADVAEALAYAHSQGILHRDIKPSNLLLDVDGTVWVTDFGLAKAAEADGLTETGDLMGTLRYMAPERFEGWSNPRSDIYSLGATLYELLTLRPLFDEPNRAKLMKMVAHEAPTAPRKLDPAIPRDLETVVLKAIAREPEQRYASAEQMAEDLRRFLADRPILARRTGGLERLWRWSRRNPALAGSIASLFLFLVLGCAGMTVLWRLAEGQRSRADQLYDQSRQSWLLALKHQAEAHSQGERAEASFVKARAAVDELLTQVSESQLLNVPGLQPLRRDLLRSALNYYEDFVRQRGDDPTLKAGLAAGQLRLAKIQHELGARVQSDETMRQALAMHELALRDRPVDLGLRDGLAQCCVHLGIGALDPLHPTMSGDEALRLFDRAITVWEELRQVEPASTVYLGELANAYNLLAVLHNQNNRTAATLAAHQKALALRQARVDAHPDDPAAQNDLASTLNNLGALVDGTTYESLDKLSLFRRSAEHSRIAHARAPQVIRFGRFLVVVLRNVAVSERQLGHYEAATRAFEESLEVSRRMARDNPAILGLRRELVQDYRSIGDLLREQGRMADAVRIYRQSLDAEEAIPRETGDDWFQHASLLALCARPASEAAYSIGDVERAECRRLADASIAALRRAIAAGYRNDGWIRISDELAVLRDRDDFHALVAEAGATRPSPPRTASATHEASPSAPAAPMAPVRTIDGGTEQVRDSRSSLADRATSQHAIGIVQLELGQLDEARTTLGHALAGREALVRDHPEAARHLADLAATRVALARLDWMAGRLPLAVRAWDEIRKDLEAALRKRPADPVIAEQLAQAEATIGQSYAERALWSEAQDAFARAVRRGMRDREVATRQASLLAIANDRAGLKALCNSMLDEYGRTTEFLFASVLARWCALVPGSVPDPGRLVSLAERAVAAGQRGPERLFRLSLAEYRAGRFAEAVRRARESLAALPEGGHAPLAAIDAAVLAMAHHRLGQTVEAQRRLDEIARIDWRAVERWPDPQAWWQRSDFLVLKREAIELLTGKPPSDDPWLRRRRGEAYEQLGQAPEAQAELRAADAAGSG
jgi:serine/threonine protein kinase